MAKTLTAAAVAKLRPGERRLEVPDGACPGLYLIIQTSGSKSWAMRYRRPNGETAKLVLGKVGDEVGQPVIGGVLSLAGARALAQRLRHELALGKDPGQGQSREAGDYVTAARDFIHKYAKPKTRRWTQTAELLGLRPEGEELAVIKGGLADRWKRLAVDKIDEDMVFRALEEARERSVSRDRVLFAALSVFFGWLRDRRVIKANPMDGLKRPKQAKARERVLTDAEIRRFWKATDELGKPFGSVLKLLLLTGARLNEIAEMRKAELSEDGKSLLLPGERTKNHRAHTIPLVPLAQELIAAHVADAEYVFTTTGKTPVSGWSKIKKQLDALMQPSEPWRIHDLRRTVVTNMGRAGVDLPVIERAVNHISGSFAGVVGIYQKHKFAEEVAQAFAAWARLLEQIVSGDNNQNVIPLRKAGK
jgi:integrase